MKYDPSTKVLVMNQTDLEHCMFSHEELEGELHLHGLDPDIQKDIHVIVVHMHKGLYKNKD